MNRTPNRCTTITGRYSQQSATGSADERPDGHVDVRGAPLIAVEAVLIVG